MGKLLAGVCHYDALKYQTKKEVRVGTFRRGEHQYLVRPRGDRGQWPGLQLIPQGPAGPTSMAAPSTETWETENEIFAISKFNYDTKYWSHYHNPRTASRTTPPARHRSASASPGRPIRSGRPARPGTWTGSMPRRCFGWGEVDLAVAGGVSESIHTFGIFAGFKSQGALATHEIPARASRPFDMARNGIVVSEGGCLYTLERLEDARARGARIYAEIAGYGVNSDASDYVLPNPVRQAQCVRKSIASAGLDPAGIHIVNTHATAT